MTRDEFLALAASHYDDMQCLNTEQTHFYDYEKGFAELWTELGRTVLEAALGNCLNRREKKYCQSRFGRIAIANSHAFKAKKTHGFFINPYLQDLMARAGVSEVYSESNDLLRRFRRK